MIGIVIVSILAAAGLLAAIFSVVTAVMNFRRDKRRMKMNFIRFGVFLFVFAGLGVLNTALILKYVYDNRAKMAGAADALISGAIDKTAEYTSRSVVAAASEYTKHYNAVVIKGFENLAISCLSSKVEITGDGKIYEIELGLDNTMPRTEDLYFGDLVVKNYLIACDKDDFAYKIVPEDADAGLTKEYGDLISVLEFFLNKEYSKFGKLLPGKTRHKILVEVPGNVDITSVRFLDTRIAIE
jgi:hypothetical protein